MDGALILLGVFAVLGYLIGSVNFAVLVAKKQGVDILKEGSGNPGATNVKRVLGKGPGNLVFGLDVLKGAVGTGLCLVLVKFIDVPNATEILFRLSVAGFAGTLLGHCFSCFLKFKGGKGVATSAGVLIGIAPLAVVIGLITWAIVFFTSGYVSLGSIVAALVVILIGWVAGYGPVTAIALTLLGTLTIWRHRSNIQRLRNGTENKFRRKSKV